jgi:hypothetical protein
MLNGWRIKHAGTDDHRRSVTGTTTAPVWIRPTGTVAITGRTIADAATTAIRGVRVFPVTAAIGATIPIKEITATLRAKKALGDDTG